MSTTDPTSSRPSLPHVPALDGLRGLAVVAVLAFHGGFSWAVGGYLGVSAFFTLSGYLITSLLVVEWDATGTISLRGFWARRFRRLLPAALVVLAAVALTSVFFADSGQLASLRADMLAALGNVANWRFVLDDRSYAELFTGPSPLQHYWSLSIEEQFYLVFPLATFLLLRATGGRRAPVATVFGTAMAASLAWAWWLSSSPTGAEQAYYDTGARAVELLAGALLALVLAGRTGRVDRHPRLLAGAGNVALVALAVAWAVVPQTSAILHRGGLALHATLVVLVLAAAHVPGPVASFCSTAPLRAAGRISYGLYLIHWPVFVWLDSARTGLEGTPLFAVRVAVTFVLALASYALVEQPVRLRRVLPGRRALAGVAVGATVVVAMAFIVPATVRPDDRITVALDGLRDADVPPPVTSPSTDAMPIDSTTSDPSDGLDPVAAPPSTAATAPSTSADVGEDPPERPVETTRPASVRTVLLVGDSVMSQAMPELEARFASRDIGVSYAGGPASGPLSPQGEWARQVDAWVAGSDPDVVVIEACCNYTYEPPTRYVSPTLGPVAPNSPQALVVWELEMRDLVRRAGAGGARVFIVRFPPVQTNGYYGPIEVHVAAVNAIYDRMIADTPSLRLIDWSATLAPRGFTWELPDSSGNPVQVRLEDGVHLTPAGSRLVADTTLAAVTS